MLMAGKCRSVGIVGCGSLGRLIAEGIRDGAAGGYRVKAVFDEYRPENAAKLAADAGAAFCVSLDELLRLKCDYVVEAASAAAVRAAAAKCLAGGSNVVALSSGAFADAAFREEVSLLARARRRKVYIPSGALGGFDLAQAATAAGDLAVTMTTEKPPEALAGAPALAGRDLSRSLRELVFSGTAREAVAGFPQNVNVVAGLSLATVGLGSVRMEVYSDPDRTGNRHSYVLEGAFGRARVEIEAAPTAGNPKSSALAAYSVLALLRKLASPIQVG
jgi:aspartate dehydrogenase